MSGGRAYCSWVGDDPQCIKFHDEDWGRRPGSDREWFEILTMEVFQAGLSWKLVLHRRESLKKAFIDYDYRAIAGWTENEIDKTLGCEGIIRNRMKVEATVKNAKAFGVIIDEHETFDRWLEGLLEEGEARVVKEFRKCFSFLGPTLIHSMLESTGRIPITHEPGCWAER